MVSGITIRKKEEAREAFDTNSQNKMTCKLCKRKND